MSLFGSRLVQSNVKISRITTGLEVILKLNELGNLKQILNDILDITTDDYGSLRIITDNYDLRIRFQIRANRIGHDLVGHEGLIFKYKVSFFV
jgi:hypothetical protein